MPASWGGKDNYEFCFEPENRDNDLVSTNYMSVGSIVGTDLVNDKILLENGNTNHQSNNNNPQLENFNLLPRKVSEIMS